ncbi:MAG: hypothetical protein IJV35_07965 [Neisseriaceae bacterium]|nr:hypothetical protein [Neisseriaceae bacterium]
MMKKHQKARKFVLSAIASSLLAMPAIVSAGNVNISQEPLLGVSKINPAMVIAVSVEFPTAYSAYVENEFTPNHAKQENLGYFDSSKCYEYVVTIKNGDGGFEDYLHNPSAPNWRGKVGDGYFKEVGDATTNGDYIGLCSGDLHWSGNMLNYMTMSALDIFRHTLTGGNRAKGVGSSPDIYQAGDPAGEDKVYLRRAMMWRGQEGGVYQTATEQNGRQDQLNAEDTRQRRFSRAVYETDVGGNKLIDLLLPKGFSQSMAQIRNGTFTDPYGNSGANASGGTNAREVVFWNSGTGFYAALYQEYAGNRAGVSPNQATYRFKQVPVNTATGLANHAPWFNVVVERPEKTKGLLQDYAAQGLRAAAMGYLPENVTNQSQYDGGVLRAKMKNPSTEINDDGTFKTNPEGASEGNSGAINYVNKFGDAAPYDNNDAVAELYYSAIRYLRNGAWKWKSDGTQERAGGNANPYIYSNLSARAKDGFPAYMEWDDPLRPEGDTLEDAQCYAPSIVVIGDTNTHFDNNLPNYNSPGGPSYYTRQHVSDNVALEKDGTTTYKKIADWQGNLYGEEASGGGNYYGTLNNNYAPLFGLAGMAHWVRVNDVRPDVSAVSGEPMHIQSFFIDVLEGGITKAKSGNDIWSATARANNDADVWNSYYLAAKFSGFNHEEGKTYSRDNFDSTKDTSLWKSHDDKDGYFPLGIPKGYAIGNNPQRMRDALIEAFQTVGFSKNTLQSAIQYNTQGTATLNVAGEGGSSSLLGSSIEKITNPDGSEAYQITNRNAIMEKVSNGELPLSLRAGYKFSERTGFVIGSLLMPGLKNKDGVVANSLAEVPLWDGGQTLFSQYHGSGYTTRQNHVWSKTGTNIVSGFTKLNPSNTELQNLVKGSVFEEDTNYFSRLTGTAANAKNLIQYILGDSSQEGNGLRKRENSLLGTSVYSSVTPIIKNTVRDFVRTVPLGAYNEKTCYYSNTRSKDYAAMSSNEGMLHIFDMTGNEVYAYMPQTALPFIANFASPTYATQEHRFVNDGASLLHEVCEVTGDTGKAKTYLVGTSGRGASSIYAIDVTDDNFAAKLEINAKNDPDIGILVSSPLVVNDGTNTPVLIFSSGYNPKSGKDEGYLFFYNLATGAQIAKVKLGGSGVGAPFGYDSDNDGVADRIYVGDNGGNIWRVNRNSSGTWGGTSGEKLFSCTSDCQPITTRPVVGQVNGGRTVVLAGTGEYFHLDDMRTTSQNYAYGIFDDEGNASVSSDSTDLLVQEFGTATAASKTDERMTYLSITQNALKDEHKGWKLVLPKGYTISSDSGFYGPKNQVAIYTAVRVNNEGNRSCQVNGSTLLIAVDAQNGGAYNQSLFDVDNDGLFNASDFVGGASAGAIEWNNALVPTMSVAYLGSGSDYNVATGDDGSGGSAISANLLKFLSTGTIRRVSWREIF